MKEFNWVVFLGFAIKSGRRINIEGINTPQGRFFYTNDGGSKSAEYKTLRDLIELLKSQGYTIDLH